MNILFPMNGLGQRFTKNGYLEPKPLIKVNGQPMAVSVLKSFDFSKEDNIYISYHRKLSEFNFEEIITRNFPNLKLNFYSIPFDTNGPAETLKESINHFNIDKQDLLIADCDTIYDENVLEKFRELKSSAIGYFFDNNSNPVYSYIIKDNDFVIKEIKEKVKISDFACNGIYYFLWNDLMLALDALSKNKIEINSPNNEAYISDLFSYLIKNNFKILSKEFKKFRCVGTPYQLQNNCGESSNKISETRFCFDLDNTLVSSPTVPGDYTTVKPLYKNINYLKKLKSNGAYIIIHTARRMKTHGGNLGKVISDIAQITIDTLKKYDIQYDELIFGKPYANFYIDDLAINADHDLSKSIGIYFNRIESRDKHEIRYVEDKCIKLGKLTGENYWYDNCPKQLLENYFPKIYINTEEKIEMDEIKDLSLSHLYVREFFEEKILEKLFSVMNDFHQYKSTDINFNLHQYYTDKLNSRMNHEFFKNNQYAYKQITECIEYFSSYSIELNDCCLIHGDPVFSNIFCSHDYKLKFIDPRGLVNNSKTIYGHILYDFAKIYQSIIGYDYVLLDRKVDQNNVNKFKNIFEKMFVQTFGQSKLNETKKITKSLLVSLLPLHKEEKVEKFLDLIKNI